ncbi:MAG: hypothetical protein KC668_19915 [Myxococcales bacterium]|nr:hypothetical protein [Myxococcales bacterium]
MAEEDDAAQAELEHFARTLLRLGRALPAARVTFLLDHLERHPLGVHNRTVAERVERALDALPDTPLRASLAGRYRALRDPHLPPIATDASRC